MHAAGYIRSELARLAKYFRIPPIGTLVLCCLILGLYLVQMETGGRRWIRAFGAVPANIGHLSSITRTGEGQALPAWLTLFTYMFVHGGWMHLLSNTTAV